MLMGSRLWEAGLWYGVRFGLFGALIPSSLSLRKVFIPAFFIILF